MGNKEKSIAIMQPYFLPYLPYFQLINSVDSFFIYGHVQYIKKGWFNRNNFLSNGRSHLYTFSIKKDAFDLNAIERFYSESFADEGKRFLRLIKNSYSRAPFFNEVFQLLSEIFNFEDINIVNFNFNSIKLISDYLQIQSNVELQTSVEEVGLGIQERVLKLCRIHEADKYVNPIGGIELYDKKYFLNHGVYLYFLDSKINTYKQFGDSFVNGLSIIDAMMFNSVEDLKIKINEFKLK